MPSAGCVVAGRPCDRRRSLKEREKGRELGPRRAWTIYPNENAAMDEKAQSAIRRGRRRSAMPKTQWRTLLGEWAKLVGGVAIAVKSLVELVRMFR